MMQYQNKKLNVHVADGKNVGKILSFLKDLSTSRANVATSVIRIDQGYSQLIRRSDVGFEVVRHIFALVILKGFFFKVHSWYNLKLMHL